MSDEGAPNTPKVSCPGLAACCAATADRQILSAAALNASRQHDDRLPHSWLEANSWEHLAAEGPRDSMIKGCLLA